MITEKEVETLAIQLWNESQRDERSPRPWGRPVFSERRLGSDTPPYPAADSEKEEYKRRAHQKLCEERKEGKA